MPRAVCSVIKQVPVVPWTTIQVAALVIQAAALVFWVGLRAWDFPTDRVLRSPDPL